MSEMSKDIMAVAIDLVGWCPVTMPLTQVHEFRDAIARALATERERCAQIAENRAPPEVSRGNGICAGTTRQACIDIAQAIRGQL